MCRKVMMAKAMITETAWIEIEELMPNASRGGAQEVGQGRLAHPAETQAGHRDAELGGRQVGIEVIDQVLGYFRVPSAFAGEFGDAGAPHLDDGELGRYEEAVQKHEHEHGDDADCVSQRAVTSTRSPDGCGMLLGGSSSAAIVRIEHTR